MTNVSETGEAVWVKVYATEAAKLMNDGRDDYLTQIANARFIFDEIEIGIKSGDLHVFVPGINGTVERPCRSVEPTFPVGDYRMKRATLNAWLKPKSAQQVPPVNGKTWTPERLSKVKAYRELHGTAAAASHFGISASLIRKKLPRTQAQPVGHSVFTHRIK